MRTLGRGLGLLTMAFALFVTAYASASFASGGTQAPSPKTDSPP